jgi:hypothetical protein
MPVMEELAAQVGVTTACGALGVPRSSRYAARQSRPLKERSPAPPPPRALTACEKATVRETLNSDRFADQAPREVYATLLDEGVYRCSVPTMYRILRENAQVQERRNQLRHPAHAKPQLVATGPNQVWTWDGRPFGRLVNVSSGTTHHQGCASSPWRSKTPSDLGSVSFQGTRASRAGKADSQHANVQERMGRG